MLTKRSKADAQSNYSDKPVGSTSHACKSSPPPDPDTHYVEIELIGEDDKPIPGETFRVELTDGTLVKEDSLNMEGKARIEGITGDECNISFPNLNDDCWEKL